jgi:alpha-N-acetylglucosaminidase
VAHFSFSGNQLNLPAILPEVKAKLRIPCSFKYRYYLNYCSFSYSMPWWNWERWEREIDMMALHGVNLPLAVVGHEAVWANVFRSFGLTEDEILNSFTGPAFRAWGWMGNIESWGGPLPLSWINGQEALQKKILERQRELGMTPILQGFAGFVPEKLKRVFPGADIKQIPGWYGFKGVFHIDPSDPLFFEIGKRFMEEQSRLYGGNHFYAADIMHEIDCSTINKDYLKRLTSSVYRVMKGSDPAAVWVMQSWSLQDEVLNSLPGNDVLALDLYCDSEPKWKTNKAFNGKPWVWCALPNFGGRTGISGKAEFISEELHKASVSPDKGKLCGIGFAPEGIESSPLIFPLLMEMAWRQIPPDIGEWVKHFAATRYGLPLQEAKEAWLIILKTVYSGPESYGPLESEICAVPSLHIKKASSNGGVKIYYDPGRMMEAWRLLLTCKEKLAASENYLFDLTDVSRQVLTDVGRSIYKNIVSAYKKKDVEYLEEQSALFLQLIFDIDELLSCNEFFLLGKWLSDAKKMALNEAERNLFEWNARRQITLWSSAEIGEFHDYANKQWSGLISSYYLPRWKLFLERLKKSLKENKEFKEEDFRAELMFFAIHWSHKKDVFPEKPRGSVIQLSEKFYHKYKLLTKSS